MTDEDSVPTPFQADCERKRNFQDPQLRRIACARCGVIRKLHYDLGHKWRRMNDREWREYCGTDGIPAAPYSRTVVEVQEGRLGLECGHWQDTASTDVFFPGVLTDCKQCEKENGMSWLNGKAAAMAPEYNGRGTPNTPPAVPESSSALQATDTNKGTTAEVARFMPVMDIEQAVARRNIIVQAVKHLMVEGVDYGTIPGSPKPALLKPGAEKLCNLFGFTLSYELAQKVEDWSGADHGGEPFFYYQLIAKVYRGEFLIAQGLGSCNSWESKYRWRKTERSCPVCAKANIRKSRDGGWYCWVKTEGCGATFEAGEPAIESQQVGRRPNPDIHDQVNTVLKMARKRCMIDGVTNAASASEFFTQDVEDFTPPQEDIDIGGRPPNSRAAQQYVAEQKIRSGNPEPIRIVWKTMTEMAQAFEAMREAVGETAWREELERYNWQDFKSIRLAIDAAKGPDREALRATVADLYRHLSVRKGGNR